MLAVVLVVHTHKMLPRIVSLLFVSLLPTMILPVVTAFGRSLSRRSQTPHRHFYQHFHLSAAKTTNDGDGHIQAYVVGYGSIMCPFSRAMTAKELAGTRGMPVMVQNTERVWSKKSIKGMTAMGVRRDVAGSQCTGVMLPVTKDELVRFDQREAGYDRVCVPMEDVARVPFLDKSIYFSDDNEESLTITNLLDGNLDDSEANIWIYVPKEFCPPSKDKPIAQTYLDTILRGCLNVSEEFAIDFLLTTKGWSSNDLEKGVENDENISSMGDVFWVNDRSEPIYGRADHEYISENIDILDRLLQEHRPREFGFRETHLISQ